MLRLGLWLLVGAAAVIGVAIGFGGASGQALNSIGAIAWLTAAVVIGLALRNDGRAGATFAAATAAAIVLAVGIRPGELAAVIVAFGVAGVLVGSIAPSHPAGWAALVPGIYLPVHLAVAISRPIIAGSTTLRTEPPPTAPLVPLAMVLAAAGAGYAIDRLRRRTE
ncbi:MAG: hypothetical protein H0V24_02005 [Chloroflexia bacterium]|nr:hypothetical protein [Chloroflexia bacterium]MDQ3412655.1 hypothetical protein [Chloroflexota bacterium]